MIPALDRRLVEEAAAIVDKKAGRWPMSQPSRCADGKFALAIGY
jgi:hypothetical protein